MFFYFCNITDITLVALNSMCMNIGCSIEPLFSYAYPIAIASMKRAGQCSGFGCTVANSAEVIIIGGHFFGRYDFIVVWIRPRNSSSSNIGIIRIDTAAITAIVAGWDWSVRVFSWSCCGIWKFGPRRSWQIFIVMSKIKFISGHTASSIITAVRKSFGTFLKFRPNPFSRLAKFLWARKMIAVMPIRPAMQ